MHKKKIAFVIQRAGIEIAGGAEKYCLEIAKHLSSHWDIEIITTCALDYTSWENHYPSGIEQIDNIRINRFPVDNKRDFNHFNKLFPGTISESKQLSLQQAEELMGIQGPNSHLLLEYIEQNKDNFDTFVFFTYLYAPTYYGLPLVADKAYLVPTAHDEVPIYFKVWDEWFKKPKGIIFNTPEEQDFLQGRFPDVVFDGPITGMGIQIPDEYSNIKFRQMYDIYTPYILYIGRIDTGKGSDELFNNFIQFKARNSIPLKLVLLGKNVIDIPAHPDIIHLGFVSDDTKFGAIEGCEFLVNSSAFESLSIVLLEAWSLNKPVLVNGHCDVLVGQCNRSKGGEVYLNFKDFEKKTLNLLENGHTYMGMSDFVKQNYDWNIIEKKYLDIIQ